MASSPSLPPASASQIKKKVVGAGDGVLTKVRDGEDAIPANSGLRRDERGVALVITLILLSVITFMAIAFLVLSTNQRTTVTQATEQNVANLAAQNANARAVAETLSWVLVTTNPFAPFYRVSTNYQSYYFTNGASSPLNVNYEVNNSGAPLTLDQQHQNLTNLLINPRPPVFITNMAYANSNEFRFYLDLNRNGKFEPSGWLGVTNSQGLQISIGGIPVVNYFIGDPQWIGGLEFPDRPHGADNPFAYRYCYIVLPASQSLDLNYIYNYAKNLNPNMPLGADGFLRNQGAATWEINLAAFLADLNTNVWYTQANPYHYYADPIGGPRPYTGANLGTAFEDAMSLLRYRYANNSATLASASSLFGVLGAQNAFGHDYIDNYSAGPPMTGWWWLPPGRPDADLARLGAPWAGSDNTNHFYTSQELFDPGKIPGNFAAHLQQAGRGLSSYDRYTFYRLWSQLGTDTDSASDLAKINLNYDNLVQTNVQGIASATNLFEWRPIDFFTNTANALLANAGYKFTVTNIQVYPTNLYTPSVQRLLQLAANIYDSTTNRSFNGAGYPFLPTVFRPIYRRTVMGTNTVVLINGYREVVGTTIVAAGTGSPEVELDTARANINSIPPLGTPPGNERTEPLVSGFPLIIGAKKGLPNFNEYAMQTYVYVSRLLEFRRDVTDGPVRHTNQMYVAAITNAFGIEAWNSYSTNYPRQIQMTVRADMTAIVTNEFGTLLLSNRVVELTNTTIANWSGWTNANAIATSFMLPWGNTNSLLFLTNSTYADNPPRFFSETHIFQQNPGFYIPRWWLNLNTRLRFILVDTAAQRLVDYVDINYWQPTMDLGALLSPPGTDCSGNPNNYGNVASQFCTNRLHGSTLVTAPTMGVINQIGVGLFGAPDFRSFTTDPYAGQDAESAVDGFRKNLMDWGPIYQKDMGKTFYKSNRFYAPLAPYQPIYVHTSWQANDPLVHYTVNDLTDLTVNPTNHINYTSDNPALYNIGLLNERYQPWGGGPSGKSNPTISPYELSAKDPGVTRSDDWEFPTNKYANIGWLGRVHRGTPWQTVFLKSTNIVLTGLPSQANQKLQNWGQWLGNPLVIPNVGQLDTNIVALTNFYADAVFSLPTNDWRILDLFSTAFTPNAARGRLSVNQTNLAAWSAILSGVNVMPDNTTNEFISPAGAYMAPTGIVAVVNGIINARTNFPNNCYQRLGDILAAPELTVASPFLTGNPRLMNDEVVERIPQQIGGLLKGSEAPRFVIYAFGQALKPAPQSIIPGGAYIGLCTNYQITAEVATRTVVRIDGALPVRGLPYNPHAVIENFNVLPPD
jgi:hypothetical protein